MPSEQNVDAARGLAVLVYIAMWFITVGLIISLVVISVTDSSSCSDGAQYDGVANSSTLIPEPGLVLAFMGDQGLRGRSKDVLRMIRQENASMVFHLGDFDYHQSPGQWIRQIFGTLSDPDAAGHLVLDYFAVVGNHDIEELDIFADYSRKIRKYLHPDAAQCCCEGRVATKATCTYRGIAFLQIGHGLSCSEDSGKEWVERELQRLGPRYPWKFCLFHVVQHKMQVESKGDEQGWEVYEACRRAGAIVASAHGHVYARTHLMSRFEDPQVIVHTNRSLRVEPGHSFAFVSGLGGNSARPALPKRLQDPWWAAFLYKGAPRHGFGALFFHIGFRGDPLEALVYFKTVNGDIIDVFHVRV